MHNVYGNSFISLFSPIISMAAYFRPLPISMLPREGSHSLLPSSLRVASIYLRTSACVRQSPLSTASLRLFGPYRAFLATIAQNNSAIILHTIRHWGFLASGSPFMSIHLQRLDIEVVLLQSTGRETLGVRNMSRSTHSFHLKGSFGVFVPRTASVVLSSDSFTLSL